MKHKTQKRPKHKIIRTRHYNNCARVRLMRVQTIFPVNLQTIVNLRMLSIAGQQTANEGTYIYFTRLSPQ